jgi:hypothetical protein
MVSDNPTVEPTSSKGKEPMDEKAMELDKSIREHLGPGAFAVGGGRDLFMEVSDTATGLVWMSTSPVTRAEFESLAVEQPLKKVGIGRAPMDRAVFLWSPGSPDQPVLQREIGGREWINVATPQKITPPDVPDAPARVSVDKAHVIGFEAGRDVSILRLPHGDYVELVGDETEDDQLVLPEGGVIEKVHLKKPWVVRLPTPTDAYFWFSRGMRSFQGPVEERP